MGCSGCSGIPVIEYYPSGVVIDRNNPCEVITVDTLDMYQYMVSCMLANKNYAAASCTQAEVQSASDILIAWIADKKIDYKSCTYQVYAPVVQDLVKRIVLSGICK